MIIGRVTGTVISTRKNKKLVGGKLLIIEPVDKMGAGRIVAVDDVGAGVGELVLVTLGSAARVAYNDVNAPVDALVVGIIDDPGKITISGT